MNTGRPTSRTRPLVLLVRDTVLPPPVATAPAGQAAVAVTTWPWPVGGAINVLGNGVLNDRHGRGPGSPGPRRTLRSHPPPGNAHLLTMRWCRCVGRSAGRAAGPSCLSPRQREGPWQRDLEVAVSPDPPTVAGTDRPLDVALRDAELGDRDEHIRAVSLDRRCITCRRDRFGWHTERPVVGEVGTGSSSDECPWSAGHRTAQHPRRDRRPVLPIAVERAEGLLVESLLEWVTSSTRASPRVSARSQERYKVASSKVDAFDAFAVADRRSPCARGLAFALRIDRRARRAASDWCVIVSGSSTQLLARRWGLPSQVDVCRARVRA